MFTSFITNNSLILKFEKIHEQKNKQNFITILSQTEE